MEINFSRSVHVIKIPKISQNIFPLFVATAMSATLTSRCLELLAGNALCVQTGSNSNPVSEHGVNKLLFGRDLMSLGRVHIRGG